MRVLRVEPPITVPLALLLAEATLRTDDPPGPPPPSPRLPLPPKASPPSPQPPPSAPGAAADASSRSRSFIARRRDAATSASVWNSSKP